MKTGMGRNRVMAKFTRLATSLALHPLKAQGAVDVFYLDGRTNDLEYVRDKDMTLDRVDQGFYFTAFASQNLSYENNAEFQMTKDKLAAISELLKNPKISIDSAINDMAENAIEVTGRLSLDQDHKRPVYYAGFLVKDAEMAAITMGSGLAYLYRNDALYPLTEDDFPMEAVDHHGNPVDNYNIYGAGRAGTIRYSNIAQLQVDDCIMLCTKEVMDVIGQKGMLELLDQAFDQEEAAQMVRLRMEKAAEESGEDVPYQFMMSFVEEVLTPSKARKDRNTAMMKAITDQDLAESKMHDETMRFDRSQISSYSAASAGLVRPEPEPIDPAPVLEAEEDARAENAHSEDQELLSGVGVSQPLAAEEMENLHETETVQDAEDLEEIEEIEDEIEAEENAVLEDQTDLSDDIQRVYPDGEDQVEEDEEDEEEEKPSKGNKTLLIIIVLIVIGLALTAVVYLLREKGMGPFTPGSSTPVESLEGSESSGSESSEDQTGTTTTEATTTTQETTQPTTTEPTTTAPSESQPSQSGEVNGAEGGSYPATYEVQVGDTLYDILRKVYKNYNIDDVSYEVQNELIGRFIEKNPETISGSLEEDNVVIYAETEIEVPDPSDLLEPLKS